MPVIYTNESNPAGLKLIISAKFGSVNYQVKIIESADKTVPAPRVLPYVETDRETVIFSSNAGAQYFYPNKEVDSTNSVQQWLDFEVYELAQSLALVIGGSSKVQKIKDILSSSLKLLNDKLKEGAPLNGKTIEVCDIAVWSALYPLHNDKKMSKEYLEPYPDILNWMTHFTENTFVKEALAEFKILDALTSYQALLIGAKYTAVNIKSSTEVATANPDVVSPEELKSAEEAFKKTLNNLPKPKKEVHPILPVAGEKNVLITSALPYVNNVPHLGNIIGCVLSSDVFARFSRLCNWNTLLIGGTDEYGTATETKALEEGLTPQQICDKYFEIHNNIYRWFNIGFDYFGRTTTPEQTRLVQDMFITLNNNGFMQTQPVEQLLCEKCNRYLADRFVEGGCPHPGCNYEDARGDQCDGCGKLVNSTELKNPRCKVCRTAPVKRTSKQFFLDLPKLEPLLHHWMEKSSQGWTNNAKVISKSWMKEGLKPRCITRDLKWGVPVPLDGYRDKVFYVWFDAPLGYVSMTSKYTKDWEKWWRPAKETDITLFQFMAKDNVPFHSVMFPATLLGANKGYTLVSHIMATEYLNYEDGKFSKSRGVGVFGTDAQETGIPSDVWRFYLLYVRPEGQDSSFSWVDLATKNNSELLNNLGNFVNRALVFTEKFFGSTVPAMNLTEEDLTVLALCTRELKSYVASLEKAKLRDGIRYILAISKHGNQYMQSTQPWVLLKRTDDDKQRAGTVVGVCVNIACLLATLMLPYMPDSSRALKAQLNAPPETNILTPDNPEIVMFLPEGHKIGKPAPLFSKIEPAQVEEMKKKFGGQQSDKPSAVSGDVSALEKAIQEQGDKVRVLKSSGSPKTTWQPEVAILLDLKKKLEAAQKAVPASAPTSVSGDVATLEKAVQEQGEKVRSLKSSGVPKATWQPEVTILLDLKKKLEAAQKAAPASAPSSGSDDVASLEKAVQEQGEKVRSLKSSGVPKATWQPEVTILLDLKKKLEAAQKSTVTASPSTNGVAIADVNEIQCAIDKQALLVRQLKEGGAAKSEWSPQVTILLDLKAKLAAATGQPSTGGKKSKK
ncbi:PREDICTED: methionine--tRNA ligase, cytoplasmic [Nicrophorus vespilloides]|uniref:Methionine--tRNA ligase, cytoplasmic n=1 Tax=Nicrophorus vespilloides TaxID=110193 RepID=A0ABM1M2N9_NICVS|nr:PREDICTED: methionine--tRNA ligase, cytoplasmic [Nicrophorus vespilloides]